MYTCHSHKLHNHMTQRKLLKILKQMTSYSMAIVYWSYRKYMDFRVSQLQCVIYKIDWFVILVTNNKCITNFVNIVNTCINLKYWPSSFKKLTLIIILKLNKLVYNSPKIFCSIALLNTIGKFIEKVISKRLQTYLITSNFIYPNQLGILKHCLTIDADLYITHLI